MMKHVTFISLLVLALCLNVQAQTGNSFKTITKKTSGTSKTSLSFTPINKPNLKSAKQSAVSQNSFPVNKNLNLPAINQNKAVRFFEIDKPSLKSAKIQTVEEQFYAFHNSSKKFTRLTDPSVELKITNSVKDNFGITHIKAQQYYKGLKVYGAESFVHVGAKKDVFNGFVFVLPDSINTTPKLSETEALQIVNADLSKKTTIRSLSAKQKQILKYDAPQVNLVVYDNKLVYEVSIRPNFMQEWKYFVNAQSGVVVNKYNNTPSDGPAKATADDLNNISRTIDTYLEDGTYILQNASESMYNSTSKEGIILTLNANNTSSTNLDYAAITSVDNTWTDKTAVSAHYGTTAVYKYFMNTFGRNSINGKGGDILSFINVADEEGNSMENAFWNGTAAFYGNGGSAFSPLAGALDVIAHELGHGVISNTANLEYQDQSGAINETFADIFGAMVDRDDWLIGEDVVKKSFSPSGALRNMADPHNMGVLGDAYWQPNHVSEMYIGTDDNGGVHVNSGVCNYAYYLFATAITKDKAEQVFYRALTNYLTSKSQFIDLRIAVIQSAKDLYGDNSVEVVEAGNAFDAVGVYDETTNSYAQDYVANPGQDYLVTYNTDLLNSYTLFNSSTSGTDSYSLTNTEMKGRVSVSDDGSGAVFVSKDDNIKFISLDPNDVKEDFLFDGYTFDNVALSKDGNRLAAISTEADTAIYVYDFVSKQWSSFKLYNPTTSNDGANAGGVVYADAIEFDHTGEYLVYDAYNNLNSNTGDDISYWDIGFIKVWDNTTNTFADGTIKKLYSSLPKKVSIGYPTFAKNSPYIIAFDYFNEATEENSIIGTNLLTGASEVITTNRTTGIPSFSKNDDKIVYTTLNESDKEAIAVIPLSSSKISASGTSSVILNDAKWPVFYTVGERSLKLAPIANFTADIKSGIVPISVKFLDMSINKPTSWSWTFEGGTPATSTLKNPTVTYDIAGTYKVSLTSTNDGGNNTITKTSYISVSANTTALNDFTEELISFYPNPTTGMLTIDTNNSFELELYSTSGLLLIKTANVKNIDLSNLNKGIYILQLKINNKIVTNKIIKN